MQRWRDSRSSRVPDAAQRSSRCAADPGPTFHLVKDGPRISSATLHVAQRPGHERHLIFSYAAAKSASGIGIEMTSLFRFWKATLSCLPDFIAASSSGETGVLA